MKKIAYSISSGLLIVALLLCSIPAGAQTTAQRVEEAQISFKAKDEYIPLSDVQGAIEIELSDEAQAQGEGYALAGGELTITQEGTYILSGTLRAGRITVNVDKTQDVRLVLNGVDITAAQGAAIYVQQADKVILSLPEETENKIADTSVGTEADGTQMTAAIFSRADITINGDGALQVNGNVNDGITTRDTLKITGGKITVTSVDDGIIGKDSVLIRGGDIAITSVGDGVKATNATDTTKGFLYMEGGKLAIDAQSDGMQAETSIRITGGEIAITAGGGSAAAPERIDEFARGRGMNTMQETQSETKTTAGKGIKAAGYIDITGGTIAVDACDDAINAGDTVTISGGRVQLLSGDDGIHADNVLALSAGSIDIVQSYEGMEAAQIDISGGEIAITASDDGLNASGGNDGSGSDLRMGRDNFAAVANVWISITGGQIRIDASGDGVDSNGTIQMDGGTLLVNGPSFGGNGYFDANGEFVVNGGTLLGLGGAEMLVTPAQSSKQSSVTVTGVTGNVGSVISLRDKQGSELFSYTAPKEYTAVTISVAGIVAGETYEVYIDDVLATQGIAGEEIAGSGFSGPRGGGPGGGFGGERPQP